MNAARYVPLGDDLAGPVGELDPGRRPAPGLPRVPLTAAYSRDTLLTMLGTPIKDRVAERRSATRREILDAAWEMAREEGLSQVTLRDLAGRVGMQAPSLYSHFESKNAIYDAMFAQAWTDCLEVMSAAAKTSPRGRRAALRLYARTFFDFAVSDLARYQLMNQRTIVGFEPSAESYAIAVEVLGLLRDSLAPHGVTRQEDLDLCVALVGGLIDAQLANDPGGDRWGRLLNRTLDMFDHNLGN
jgi:AcrR family transcriptional regulator